MVIHSAGPEGLVDPVPHVTHVEMMIRVRLRATGVCTYTSYIKLWLLCLNHLFTCTSKVLDYLIWWRSFQKGVVCTKLYIYLCIIIWKLLYASIQCIWIWHYCDLTKQFNSIIISCSLVIVYAVLCKRQQNSFRHENIIKDLEGKLNCQSTPGCKGLSTGLAVVSVKH